MFLTKVQILNLQSNPFSLSHKIRNLKCNNPMWPKLEHFCNRTPWVERNAEITSAFDIWKGKNLLLALFSWGGAKSSLHLPRNSGEYDTYYFYFFNFLLFLNKYLTILLFSNKSTNSHWFIYNVPQRIQCSGQIIAKSLVKYPIWPKTHRKWVKIV